MTKYLALLLIALAVATIIGLLGSWKVYQYRDCKKVGHSTFYCVMRIGE